MNSSAVDSGTSTANKPDSTISTQPTTNITISNQAGADTTTSIIPATNTTISTGVREITDSEKRSNPIMSCWNFVRRNIVRLGTNETITYLMRRLDNEQNQNLFYLVNFLEKYYSSTTLQSEKCYQELIDSYGELINKVNNPDYEIEVKNKLKSRESTLLLKDISQIPNHRQMIDKFKHLSGRQQGNVRYLAWYILYCQIIQLDVDNPKRRYPIWHQYSVLVQQIKTLGLL
jgi:hypothetical protein